MDGRSTESTSPSALDRLPQRRVDAIKDIEVIIAPQRLQRPNAIRLPAWPTSAESCPFCPGHEGELPEPVRCFPSASDWRVKLVPNKYPILAKLGSSPICGSELADGIHEVLIESPAHQRGWSELSHAHLHLVLLTVQTRFKELQVKPGVRQGVFFKNHGPAAGASLSHIHSQILGLPQTPRKFCLELQRAVDWWRAEATCFMCRRFDAARKESRLIGDSQNFVSFCPSVSRFPYQFCVAPRRHASHFEHASPAEIEELGSVLHAQLARLEQVLPNVCYNLVLHSAPFDTHPNDHYHWHVEVYPRIAKLAGFELLTGDYVNPVDPVDAAKLLQPER